MLSFRMNKQFLCLIGLSLVVWISPSQTWAQEIPVKSFHPASAYKYLNVGQVKTAILPGADNFWDLDYASYEVPKGSGKNSIFAGALWIGGIDPMGEVRVASQSYRQTGNDFYPGPISDPEFIKRTSLDYGKVWSVYRSEVDFYRRNPDQNLPQDILTWPGNGDPSKGQAEFIAPFVDLNGNGVYEPKQGDYPAFDFDGNLACDEKLLGDQVIFSVYHDQAIHSESGSKALGIEVREMVYAFADTGMLGHQVFVQHTAINRSNNTYTDFYWGNWLDPDIGNYQDDFVGSHVPKGLGYVYNGDQVDEGPNGYGINPPAAGLHFLQGPDADQGDGIDNDRDGLIDEPGEEIKMSNFITYTNASGAVDGKPSSPQDYHYYLQSTWLDGQAITHGQDGRVQSNPRTTFMYPGSSDTAIGWALGGNPNNPVQSSPWSEETIGNTPSTRRFLASAGPFTFQPGEVRKITTNYLWGRGNNGPQSSVNKLILSADSMQALFGTCFETRPCKDQVLNLRTKIEGSQITLFFDGQPNQIQIDYGDGNTSTNRYSSHTYEAPGKYLVEFTSSGSCGNMDTLLEVNIPSSAFKLGYALRRIEGQGSGGQVLRLSPEIIPSIFKQGNNGRPDSLIYQPGYSPIQVFSLQPDLVPQGNYEIRLKDMAISPTEDSLYWQLFKVGGTDTFYSTKPVHFDHTQYIPEYHLYLQTKAHPYPEFDLESSPKNTYSISIEQEGLEMLDLVQNQEHAYFHSLNWIQNQRIEQDKTLGYFQDLLNYQGLAAPYRIVSNHTEDSSQAFHQPVSGAGPAWEKFQTLSTLENLDPVILVLTPNQDLWTRCPVIEMCEFPNQSIGGAHKFDLRQSPSLNKAGNLDASGTTGYSWFPGYAINKSNGQRVHLAFGENSCDPENQGTDMLFNPTLINKSSQTFENNTMGGRHYIYIMSTPYTTDEERDFSFYDWLDDGIDIPDVSKRSFTSNLNFTLVPENLKIGPLTGETRIHIDFPSPFGIDYSIGALENNGLPRYGFRASGEDIGQNPDLSLTGFPNPAIHQWYFKLEGLGADESFEIQVYNSQGALVFQNQNRGSLGFVPLRNLAQGVYHYRLQARGREFMGKFVHLDP